MCSESECRGVGDLGSLAGVFLSKSFLSQFQHRELLKLNPIWTLPCKHIPISFFSSITRFVALTLPHTMVDWGDPTTIAASNLAFIKFTHVIGGVYMWEFVSHIDFEYAVITRKRKFTWSFLLYLGCRLCPLLAIMSQFMGFDVSHKIDCQAWVLSSFLFGNLAFAFASALVILRVAAIWELNKFVIILACAVWFGNVSAFSYSMAPVRSTWTDRSCIILHPNYSKISVLSAFLTDLILLVLMLIGLMRWKNAPQSSGVWRLLRNQCLTWIVIVTLAGVPTSIFVFLNLNDPSDPMNLIFQVLALIITSLGAARLHRGLVDYPALARSTKAASGIERATNGLNSEATSPLSHHSYQTKREHDTERVSVVLDALPAATSSTEAHKVETFDGGNIV
ncbi:hypothetical protein EI94DRAFT_798114 [Lactarius quietus]|nr:hypothetical protein EI94DRAFT_798114 [Lactarius quietus]